VTTADLLLHPVRLRIVQALLGDRAMTTSELSRELAGVPPASLYRHIARLVDGGVLSVVAERRVRGTVERAYVLRAAAARLSPDEIAKMTPEEHRAAFLGYVAGLIGDFERYLASGHIDPVHDGASYSLAGLWLDDAELLEFLRDLSTLAQTRLANTAATGRTRRIFATILLPDVSAATPTMGPKRRRQHSPTRTTSN